jgi:hypothetical protein
MVRIAENGTGFQLERMPVHLNNSSIKPRMMTPSRGCHIPIIFDCIGSYAGGSAANAAISHLFLKLRLI